jgi:hypothetical protein
VNVSTPIPYALAPDLDAHARFAGPDGAVLVSADGNVVATKRSPVRVDHDADAADITRARESAAGGGT